MIWILAITITILLLMIFVSFLKERHTLSAAQTKQDNLPPVLSLGSKLNLMWGERSVMVTEEVSVRASAVEVLIYYIKKILFLSNICGIKSLINLSQMILIKRMREKASDASFIANLRIVEVGNRPSHVDLIGYGTAIYMKPEDLSTLPAFHAPCNFSCPNTSIWHLAKRTIAMMCVVISMPVFIYCASVIETKRLLSNPDALQYQYELRLFEALERTHNNIVSNIYDADAVIVMYAERKLQSMLDAITTANQLDPMTLHIYHEGPVDIFALPSGKIIISDDLIKQLHYIEEVQFLLAQMVYMYNSGQYLKMLGNSLGGMEIFCSNGKFCIDSMINNAKVFQRKLSASDQKIIDASAMQLLNATYRNVAGAYYFISNVHKKTMREDIIPTKHKDAQIIENIKYLIKTHKYPYKINPSVNTLFSAANIITQDSREDTRDSMLLLHERFLSEARAFYSKYKVQVYDKNIALLNIIQNRDSIEGIDSNTQIAENAIMQISVFKNELSQLEQRFSRAISNYIKGMGSKPSNQKVFQIWWAKEKRALEDCFDFYFERDTQIFKLYIVESRFLKPRFGTFYIKDNQITINDTLAKSHYLKIAEKIENLMSTSFHDNERVLTGGAKKQNDFFDSIKDLF